MAIVTIINRSSGDLVLGSYKLWHNDSIDVDQMDLINFYIDLIGYVQKRLVQVVYDGEVFSTEAAVAALARGMVASLVINDSSQPGTTVKEALDSMMGLLSGTVNPNGTFIGVLGQTYHDTDDDLFYKCISEPVGTEWILL